VFKVAAGIDTFIERVLHGPTDKALLRTWRCETRGRESARFIKAEVHSRKLTGGAASVSLPNVRTVVIVVTSLSSGLLRLARDADFSLHQTSVSAPGLTGCNVKRHRIQSRWLTHDRWRMDTHLARNTLRAIR
jgi:hypothetical protein